MNSSTGTRRITRAALIAAAGAGLSFLGVAAPSAGGQSVSRSSETVSTTSNDQNITVRLKDGKYTILLNGKEVRSGEIDKENWDEYVVKNDKGEEVGTVVRDGNGFSVEMADDDSDDEGNIALTIRGNRGDAARLAELRGAFAPRASLAGADPFMATPPKTMLGVGLGTPDPSLAAHIGVEPEEATVINSISKGLPAAKAGLKVYDVIVKIDGKTPAGEDEVRDALRTKNPGDTVTFEVVHGNNRKVVDVTLEAYDPAKLGVAAWNMVPSAPAIGQQFTFPGVEAEKELEAQSAALQELARQLAEKAQANQSQAGGDAERALHEEMKELAEQIRRKSHEMAELGTTGAWSSGPGQVMRLWGQRGSGRAGTSFVVPTPAPPALSPMNVTPGAMNQDMTDRMNKLDDRLNKLQELLEKVIEQKGSSAGGGSAKDH